MLSSTSPDPYPKSEPLECLLAHAGLSRTVLDPVGSLGLASGPVEMKEKEIDAIFVARICWEGVSIYGGGKARGGNGQLSFWTKTAAVGFQTKRRWIDATCLNCLLR